MKTYVWAGVGITSLASAFVWWKYIRIPSYKEIMTMDNEDLVDYVQGLSDKRRKKIEDSFEAEQLKMYQRRIHAFEKSESETLETTI